MSKNPPRGRSSPVLTKARQILATRKDLPACRYVNLIKLKAQGMTNKEIGKLLGIHEVQVSSKLPEAIDWVESGCHPSHDRRTWGIYAPSKPKAPSKAAKTPVRAPRPEAEPENQSEESRFTRLLGLLYKLSSEPATVGQLAVEHQATERTIQRDLVLLRSLGFQVERLGRGKGVRFTEGIELPSSVVTKLFGGKQKSGKRRKKKAEPADR